MPEASSPSRATSTTARRRLPIGAELARDGQVHVRVWAPDHAQVSAVMDGRRVELVREEHGYFSGLLHGTSGSRYGFLLGDDPQAYPDPASRFQPDGPHGLSEVVDPHAYQWTDGDWRGVDADDPVFYEMHLGTFTAEGTAAAALGHLESLAEMGITVLQVMPLAEFPGRFGWGYDGVSLFAPSRLYGRPDDFRRLVDHAHALGLAVILDVVYNHVGPDGNYLRCFARDYFSDRYENEWGDALNFDGPQSGPVREWVLANVEYWVREFHLDGFRLDATQQIFDASRDHLLAAIVRTARASAEGRRVIVSAENEPQHARLVQPEASGGYGLDAIYNEDFHHSARLALVGTHEAYFTDYRGVPSEWLACARFGALYQGQHYAWQQQSRGTPVLRLPASAFVAFLENHDQIANTDSGRRLVDLARPSDLRAMTGLLLLQPSHPMLFQGQEFGSRAPFVYFADHEPPLCDAVAKGRRDFLGQFMRLRAPEVFAHQPAPHEERAWRQSQLRRAPDDPAQAAWRSLVTDLLRLRRARPRLRGARVLDGAAPDDRLLVLRYFGDEDLDWLLLLNRGPDRDVASLSEPLIAPPAGRTWQQRWSSESPSYGGQGTMAWSRGSWPLPGHSLTVLHAVQDEDASA
jgi:maltooligosyltrehalose trehalohydrolase